MERENLDKVDQLHQKKQRIISLIGKEKFDSTIAALKELDVPSFILLDIAEYHRLEDSILDK